MTQPALSAFIWLIKGQDVSNIAFGNALSEDGHPTRRFDYMLSNPPFGVEFADKKTNLTGLQLADLVARPVGLDYVRPAQTNKAFEVLKRKFFCDGGRTHVGQGYRDVGLRVYPPQKAKSPDEPTEAVAPTGNPQST